MISALKNNNEFTKKYLAKLLISILRTNEKICYENYDLVATYFFEMVGFYDSAYLNDMCNAIMINLRKVTYREETFDILLEKSLKLIKFIFNTNNIDVSHCFELFNSIFILRNAVGVELFKAAAILSQIKIILEIDEVCRRRIMMNEEFVYLLTNVCKKESYDVNSIIINKLRSYIYTLLNVYADDLIKHQNQVYFYSLKLFFYHFVVWPSLWLCSNWLCRLPEGPWNGIAY